MRNFSRATMIMASQLAILGVSGASAFAASTADLVVVEHSSLQHSVAMSSNQSVKEGKRLFTKSDQWAELSFSDGTSIALAPDTSLSILPYANDEAVGRDTLRVEVESGSIRVMSGGDSASTVDVVTPSAVVRVENASAHVNVKSGMSDVTFLWGRKVTITNAAGTEELLRPDFHVTAKGNQEAPFPPRRVSPADFKRLGAMLLPHGGQATDAESETALEYAKLEPAAGGSAPATLPPSTSSSGITRVALSESSPAAQGGGPVASPGTTPASSNPTASPTPSPSPAPTSGPVASPTPSPSPTPTPGPVASPSPSPSLPPITAPTASNPVIPPEPASLTLPSIGNLPIVVAVSSPEAEGGGHRGSTVQLSGFATGVALAATGSMARFAVQSDSLQIQLNKSIFTDRGGNPLETTFNITPPVMQLISAGFDQSGAAPRIDGVSFAPAPVRNLVGQRVLPDVPFTPSSGLNFDQPLGSNVAAQSFIVGQPNGSPQLSTASQNNQPNSLLCSCTSTTWGVWTSQLNQADTVVANVSQGFWVAGIPTTGQPTGTAFFSGNAIGNVFNAGKTYLSQGTFSQTWTFGTSSGAMRLTFDGQTYTGQLKLSGNSIQIATTATGPSFSGTGAFFGALVPFTPTSNVPAEVGGRFSISRVSGTLPYNATGIFAGQAR